MYLDYYLDNYIQKRHIIIIEVIVIFIVLGSLVFFRYVDHQLNAKSESGDEHIPL